MKINFRKTVTEQIYQAVKEAAENQSVIESIELTKEEAKRLDKECAGMSIHAINTVGYNLNSAPVLRGAVYSVPVYVPGNYQL